MVLVASWHAADEVGFTSGDLAVRTNSIIAILGYVYNPIIAIVPILGCAPPAGTPVATTRCGKCLCYC